MATVTFLGHGSLKLTTQKGHVIYIDPFMSPKGENSSVGYEDAADAVLVTHQHYDHTAIDKMKHAPGCVVWQNMDSHPSPDTYLTLELFDGEVEVRAVEAYNKMHKKDACVGYVVSLEGKRVYFAGDTGPTSEMKRLADDGLDLAFLPGDGIYTMTAEDAAKCANLIGAKRSVPIHLKPVTPYGEAEAVRFAAVAKGATLVRPGESIEV